MYRIPSRGELIDARDAVQRVEDAELRTACAFAVSLYLERHGRIAATEEEDRQERRLFSLVKEIRANTTVDYAQVGRRLAEDELNKCLMKRINRPELYFKWCAMEEVMRHLRDVSAAYDAREDGEAGDE